MAPGPVWFSSSGSGTLHEEAALMKELLPMMCLFMLAAAAPAAAEAGEGDIKITILYDNTAAVPATEADWGFACLVEGMEKTILFDTGTKPEVFFHNVEALDVDLAAVDLVVISHEHGDHTGSLARVLEQHPGLPVYHPVSFSDQFVSLVATRGGTSIPVAEPIEIIPDVSLTGQMGGDIKEQSLILRTGDGLVVITGCSHPGIVEILERTKQILDEDIFMVFGGFHLMRHSDEQMNAIIESFKRLGVQKCGATHCTGEHQITMLQDAYGDNFVPMGTGRVLTFTAAE
jgi:7,8-dihydropterin-6-yl-methyl-4-(beta-D-ribofuranosyl)aminobenzene 5'-phosphate synthase